jgi:hypothetical protein
LIDVSLNAGDNTIKLRVVEQNGGPNIDHLRVGKPPAIVLKSEYHCQDLDFLLLGYKTRSHHYALLRRNNY